MSICIHVWFSWLQLTFFYLSGNTDDLALPPFVDFNNLTSYHLSDQGTKTVAKILAVIQNTNPEILYCPTLYPKLSIFLHYMGPSDAFNCIYALLRSKDANIMQTKVAVESSKLVLRDLTKKYAVMHIFFSLIHVQSYIFRQIFRQCYKVEIEFYSILPEIILHVAKIMVLCMFSDIPSNFVILN